jgi:PAS domain S-box-containing protein
MKRQITKNLKNLAKEKESVRRKLVVTANKLRSVHKTLENKVLARTKDIERAKAKDEAILASIGDGMVVVNKEGKVTYVNQAFEKMVGWKMQEVLGKYIVEVVPREDQEGNVVLFNERILTKVLSGEKVVADLTMPFYYIRKDKTRFPASSIVTPIILEGKIIGLVETFRDITKEKGIDKAKTEFISLASHQLRTPLTTISWYTEMILSGDVGKVSAIQKQYLEEIYLGTRRMVDLVNTLLDVSRLELGTFVAEPKITDIILLAKSVLNEQKSDIDKKKLLVIHKFGKGRSNFAVDPKLLRMIFQNLLSNAVKYTPVNGKIEFTVSFDSKNIKIKMADTGYGIPKNQQGKIFTKLFRADNVRDKDTDGTGLGLYIAKSIVENSGGKIWFESEDSKASESPGTTFYVTLPIVKTVYKSLI